MNDETEKSLIGSLGLAVAAFGLVFSYLACLHGTQFGPMNFVAFALWLVVFLLAAFLVEFVAKFAVILALVGVGYLWWTDHPEFRKAATSVREVRNNLCNNVNDSYPDMPFTPFFCPQLS